MLHLHNNYSFTESLVETVIRSLRHSCRSELTRQGTSLSVVTLVLTRGRSFLPASACRHAARTVPSPARAGPGVQSLRIPKVALRSFLLMICTQRVVTADSCQR